ncbi:hypothetical protein TELCIR_05034 [Teladorsagia circumcincta]|uniref:Globin n=1 Tax=Teladorsagia circumcincta TaxID=45464 RepID=A0A2G9URY2_TELCI|nr:hypothetical protein TELCIR_05034 [Teladorsagia circumcincta]
MHTANMRFPRIEPGVMSLFSTIRGKKGVTGIGSAAVGPIANKTKKLVIQEWPRMLEHQPNLFGIVWISSATRSNSIKKTFGIGANENPEDNEAFMKIWPTVQQFFHKLVCMAETVDQTLCEYYTDDLKRAEMILAWQRVFNTIVHHMRTGYIERRKEQITIRHDIKPEY